VPPTSLPIELTGGIAAHSQAGMADAKLI
jgi:hypothetical protein